jgi:phosphatidylglycerol:prolipoprotein diacylglycerol transferase
LTWAAVQVCGGSADAAVPWAMVFPQSGSLIPRHPSQIYQFLGEGILLFVILWLYARRPHATGAISGVFMIGYSSLRFMAEYFREPDAQLGLLAFGMTMGQWLCIPMFIIGLLMWFFSIKRIP